MLRKLASCFKNLPPRHRGVSALAAVGLLGCVGVAAAAIPAADGTIKSCYATASGTPRIVDEAETCRSYERALTWNQEGQKGDPGERGEQGEQGEDGPPGPAGTRILVAQKSAGAGQTLGCKDVKTASHPIHLDAPGAIHVEASLLATGHAAGRVAKTNINIETPDGRLAAEVQGTGVPVGDGAGLTMVSGFPEEFIGTGPRTFPAGDYVLVVVGQALGLCDGTATDFSGARVAWWITQ